MKINKKIFIYKNRIILTNGSLINVYFTKYIKNYQLNINFFNKKKNNNTINQNDNKKKSIFFSKILT